MNNDEGHEECKSEVSTIDMDCDEDFEEIEKPIEPVLKRKRTDSTVPSVDAYKMMELPPDEVAQPYTCICFSEPHETQPNFYTTDQNGFFLHKKKYYRCVMNGDMEISFKFIRELDLPEIVALQSLDVEDINVIKDLSTNNKSLLY